MDNSQYLYNEKIILLICSAVFIIIYIIYLFPILIYIFKKCLKNKLCVYWIDYSFLIASGIIFIFTFIIKLIKETLEDNQQYIKYEVSKNLYYILIKVYLNLMCLTIKGSLLFDSIIVVYLHYY